MLPPLSRKGKIHNALRNFFDEDATKNLGEIILDPVELARVSKMNMTSPEFALVQRTVGSAAAPSVRKIPETERSELAKTFAMVPGFEDEFNNPQYRENPVIRKLQDTVRGNSVLRQKVFNATNLTGEGI